MKTIRIGNRLIGEGQPCFIIAEAGVNHNGRLDLALKLVDKAVEACADAVKFQSFRAASIVARGAPKAEYQRAANASGADQYEMLKKLELGLSEHRAIRDYCKKRNIMFLSTPFDEESLEMLIKLGVPALKIGSGELTNLPFLRYAAGKRLPMILSTGMSTLPEIRSAVRIASGHVPGLALLHCVSSYPARAIDANLKAIGLLRDTFNLPCGFSDHVKDNAVSLAAVALGACIIEKHLTLNNKMAGPDHKASLAPADFKLLVEGIRTVEAALGSRRKAMVTAERDVAKAARRSIFTARAISAGTVVTEKDFVLLRPGNGLPPAMLDKLYGKKSRGKITAFTMIKSGMFK